METNNWCAIPSVLIIEDETDTCLLLEIILKKKNILASFANTLQQAGKEIKARRPFLVFLDNELPDGRGIDFIDVIKRIHPNSRIILCGAYYNDDDKERALSMGVDQFLSKPYSSQDLNVLLKAFPIQV